MKRVVTFFFAIALCGFSQPPLPMHRHHHLEPEPGHSHQGAAFDEGPRQFAKLTGGTGNISFQVNNCSNEATQFINQGVGQLHGFLHYEAERSFRQAAFLDDKCAMAFWGVAMSSTLWVQNIDRAIELIDHAKKRLTDANSPREHLYVKSIEEFKTGRSGAVNYVSTLKKIWQKNPDDLDAKAFFIAEVWSRNFHNHFGYTGLTSRERNMPLYELAKEILAVNPLHPVHHYVIHMWDNKEDFELGLESADINGFAGPKVAHMWHMQGHTYSQANLPFDTWWSQEASARVDHAYMRELNVFPFMLHNHAHNNEWLTRSLLRLGNFGKALQMSLNFIGLPRHPKYNDLKQVQSHMGYGVKHTLTTLEAGHYWKVAAKLYNSPFLQCVDFEKNLELYSSCIRVGKLTEVFTGKSFNLPPQPNLEYAAEIDFVKDIVLGANARSSFVSLKKLNHLQKDWGLFSLVRYGEIGSHFQEAEALANKLVNQDKKNVAGLMLASLIHSKNGNTNHATELLKQAQTLSQEFDLNSPSLQAISSQLGVDEEWIKPFANWREVHARRPELASMGLYLWQPPKWQNFRWLDKDGNWFDFEEATNGKPAVVLFILSDCPLCSQQYMAFEEQRESLEAMGVSLIAITGKDENIPAFKQVGAFDEFESIPLHGLYIVNKNREIVWQDIAAVPFMEIPFFMKEVERLLNNLQPKIIGGKFEEM